MASGQLSTVLQHIHRLAGAAGPDEPTDAQLLERFADAREEEAFAALVRRYGALVLGVCRRVLRHQQDAEDAFQATFLILARKAASIRKREALGYWLHGVALRTALDARGQLIARRLREQRVQATPQTDSLAAVIWRDLQPVLDEEVQGLPDKYRAAFVLCYLEGKTYAQAAARLRCRPGTLSRRLSQARELLRARLSRRGLAIPAGLLATTLMQHCVQAVVPAALAASTVRAALWSAAGTTAAAAGVPAQAVALAEGGLQAMTKGKTTLAVVLAAALVCAGAGTLAHRALAGKAEADVAQAALAAQRRQPPTAPVQATPKTGGGQPARPGPADKAVTAAGRVFGADGNPLAGAQVALIGLPKSAERRTLRLLGNKILGHTTTGKDGRFRLALPRELLADSPRLYALAGHPGHGLAWERIKLDAPAAETALHLPAERVIRGRLQDLQGQPAAGVRVKVSWVGMVPPGDASSTRLGELPKERFPLWPGPVTADREGKFVIHGLNPDHEGYLHFESDRFAFQWEALKRDKGLKVQEVNLSLAPAQLIEGVVTAADTGKPLAHAQLMVNAGDNVDSPRAMGPGMDGQTDAQGRFRLNPPPGKLYTLHAEAPTDQPYLRLEKTFRWPQGSVRQQVNLALPRGVLVQGKVTEVVSGKPVAGAVVRDAVGLWTNPSTKTGPDGGFRITVAPGRGHLLIKGPGNDFIPVEATDGDLQRSKRHGYRFYPDALVPLDLKAGMPVPELSVQLRRGVTIRGTLTRPDGKPAANAVLLCWNQVPQHAPMWFAAAVAVRDGQFELRGCEPERTYTVHFLDAKNELGATARLSFKEAGGKAVAVRLSPCGTATARFVNKEGKPIPDFRPLFYIVARPGPHYSSKEPSADSDFVANVDRLHYATGDRGTDAAGRSRYPALIPGATYRILDYDLKVVREFRVEAGQTLALGDIVIRRSQ